MTKHNKLSAREKREAEKPYLKGKNIKQVAEAISRSYTGVRNHLKKKKLTRKRYKKIPDVARKYDENYFAI